MEYLSLISLHVFFGIIWAGGAIVTGLFIIPAVTDAGPAGGIVMAGVAKRKLPIALTVSALLVVLTGVRLYMIRFTAAWLTSPEGIVLTLGAVLAIGAFVLGVGIQKPTVQRLGALSAAISASGKPPTPEQQSEIVALRDRLRRIGTLTAFHLIGAAALMALHRLAVAL